MAVSGNDDNPLFGVAAAGAFRLTVYLVAAGVLMVADARSHYGDIARRAASQLSGPIYWVASAPARAWRALTSDVADREQLTAENRRLREDLLTSEARLARLAAVGEQNERLRALLQARNRLGLKVQLAELIDVDLDPFRQRVLIDHGSRDGVSVGQAAMDARGVLGQVVAVEPGRATLLLLTDASAAVPVRVERSGFRTVAYGTGDPGHLRLPHIPFSADVKVGDDLTTSGLGGRFPAGLPVGTIESLKPDDSATLVVATARPAAGMARSGEVLLLHEDLEPIDDNSLGEAAAVDRSIGPPSALAGSPPRPATAPSTAAKPPAAASSEPPR